MAKLYFLTGSQSLYGEDALRQAAEHGREIARYLDSQMGEAARIEALPIVASSEDITAACRKASCDDDCVGVIAWMHTFSPAKMWIKGLQCLSKPLLHLHTQYNEKLPYDSIDMDFMNLNQSAHGDREYAFILSRLGIRHHTAVGYYKDADTVAEVRRFAETAKAVDYSRKLRVAMLGGNMREVAVTDGDRVESQIRYGWEVNYYGVGDLAAIASGVGKDEAEAKLAEYGRLYDIKTEDIEAVRTQAAYEIALRRFLSEGGFGAFTDTFQDLHGLEQLPGLAVQRLMAEGVGFAAEGDYKTAALSAVLWKLAEGRKGATGFMEDYTYDFARGLVLGAHMLEVSPAFAAERPRVEVHPLGIGGKRPPARLVFDGVTGSGVAVCMTDMGDRFRLICAEIELVGQPEATPRLPVARLMWKPRPDFKTGIKAWLEAGGGHHTVVSTALASGDIELFAKLTGTELVLIK